MMEFIKDINEARMTRNSSDQRVLTFTDCCERLYLTILILELLRQFPKPSPVVRAYTQKTTQHDGYNHFRMNNTDLYNFIYFVTGDDDALDKLKDPDAAKKSRQKVTLPTMGLNRYLTQLSTGTVPNPSSSGLFIKIEGSLGIVNSQYKFARRIVTNWNTSNILDRKKAGTTLLFAARAKLRNSDIIDALEKLNADVNLNIPSYKDPEPKVSTPDLTVASKDLIYYKYLVGTENLALTRKFVELTGKGSSMPSNMVKAYAPVVQMVNDIVNAGPAYVQMLRTIHNKAKKQKK